VRIGSLFAGIGGFDLAARWMGWETAWFSEIDPYASAVLAKHWPNVPNHGDITQIDFTQVEPVDMLCGGFPCQDISNAGKRKGIEGERSGLWSEYARAIGELRPRYVVVENVAALLGRGLERVLGDLAALGYDAEWTVLSAADVGAPHLRERLWITAYASGEHGRARRAGRSVAGSEGQPVAIRALQVADADLTGLEGRVGCGVSECPGERAARARGASLADATSEGLAERLEQEIPRGVARAGEGALAGLERRGGVGGQFTNWEVEPDVGRVADGVPARVDRLRGLGNAIVPQCAFEIFRAIEAAEAARRVA
jgi:DNA (cytosine-5)-methyltransferase 1